MKMLIDTVNVLNHTSVFLHSMKTLKILVISATLWKGKNLVLTDVRFCDLKGIQTDQCAFGGSSKWL